MTARSAGEYGDTIPGSGPLTRIQRSRADTRTGGDSLLLTIAGSCIALVGQPTSIEAGDTIGGLGILVRSGSGQQRL